MTQQSSALRRLDVILDKVVTHGKREEFTGFLLLRAMNLKEHPKNIVSFYELLVKAEEEGNRLRGRPRIPEYLRILDQLHEVFASHHLWRTKWDVFVTHIHNEKVLIILDALANYFEDKYPGLYLEQDFLDKLNGDFGSILNGIPKSDLSKELKRFLTEQIEDILKAIRRYQIDGTEGLKKVSKSFVSDLAMSEHTLDEKDKSNPLYKHVKASFLSLLIWIAPSPYDIIGAVPDIHDFWVPQFEHFLQGREQVEKIVDETSTIQDALEQVSREAPSIFGKQEQKSIAGKDQKFLPPSSNDQEITNSDEDNL